MTSENLEALRREVRDWLRANLPKGWGTPEYVPPERYSRESHELGKEWTKKLYEAGYTGFNYPKEYGGIERPREEIAVINEEMARTGTPGGPLSLGLLVAAPAILVHGEEWQKKRFIPKILSGEESWCEDFPSLTPVRTWQMSRPPPSGMVTSGWSTDRRSGPACGNSPTGVCSWQKPSPTPRGTAT